MKLLQFLMQGRGGQSAAVLQRYQENAEYFMCACLQKGNRNVQKTPGGLLFWQQWNNIQFVTSASFLLTVYSDYLTAARKNIQCPGGTVQKHSMWQQSLALRDRWHQFSWSGKSKGCSTSAPRSASRKLLQWYMNSPWKSFAVEEARLSYRHAQCHRGPGVFSALATVASDAADCLCQLFGTNTPLGFPINQTRVLILPGLCNVNTPPLTQCTGTPL